MIVRCALLVSFSAMRRLSQHCLESKKVRFSSKVFAYVQQDLNKKAQFSERSKSIGSTVKRLATQVEQGFKKGTQSKPRAVDRDKHPCLVQDLGSCKPGRCPFEHLPADRCLRELKSGHCSEHAEQRCPWKHDNETAPTSTQDDPHHAVFEDAKAILQLFADAMSCDEKWSQNESGNEIISPVFCAKLGANILAGASIEKTVVVTCLLSPSECKDTELFHDTRAVAHTRAARVLQKFPFLFREVVSKGNSTIVMSQLAIEYVENQSERDELSIRDVVCWLANQLLTRLMTKSEVNARMRIDLLNAMHLLSTFPAATVQALHGATDCLNDSEFVSVLFMMLHPKFSTLNAPLDLSSMTHQSLAIQKSCIVEHVTYWEARMRCIASSMCFDAADSELPLSMSQINQFVAITESVGRDLELAYKPALRRTRGVVQPTNADLFDPCSGSRRCDTAEEYMNEFFWPLRSAFVSHILQLCIENIAKTSGLLSTAPSCTLAWCQFYESPLASSTSSCTNIFTPALDALFSGLHANGLQMKADRNSLYLSFEQRHQQWVAEQLKPDKLGGDSAVSRQMRSTNIKRRALKDIERRNRQSYSVSIRDFLPKGTICIRPVTTLTLLRKMQYSQKKPYGALKHCVGMKRVSDTLRTTLAKNDERTQSDADRSTGDLALEMYFDFDESIGAEACNVAATLGQEEVLNVFWNALRKRGCISAAKYCLAISSAATGADIVNAVLNLPTSSAVCNAIPRRVGLCPQTVQVMLMGAEHRDGVVQIVSPSRLRQILVAIGSRPMLLDANTAFLLFRCLGGSDAVTGATLLLNDWDSPVQRVSKNPSLSSLDCLKRTLQGFSADEASDGGFNEHQAMERAKRFDELMQSLTRSLQRTGQGVQPLADDVLFAGSCGFITGLTTPECRKWTSALGCDAPSRFLSKLFDANSATAQKDDRNRCVARALHKHVTSANDVRLLAERQLAAMESGQPLKQPLTNTQLNPSAILIGSLSQVSKSVTVTDALRTVCSIT
jgi:hypothetical protein